jgi:penicillin-binding protein 2
MIGGIASNGHFVRPHIVDPVANKLPPEFQQAIKDSFPGSGEATIPLDPENWSIITEGMAGATDPAMGGTAAASHLEGVDFAGKTGTAQVASHEAIKALGGGKEFLPNGWFVGVIPRRNPEFVVAVLWEHGDWGSNAARLAAQVATVYVNKQREDVCKKSKQDCNLIAGTGVPGPVEMGAVWTETGPAGRNPRSAAGRAAQTGQLRGGHFTLHPAPLAPASSVASSLPSLPAWLLNMPVRFKEGRP